MDFILQGKWLAIKCEPALKLINHKIFIKEGYFDKKLIKMVDSGSLRKRWIWGGGTCACCGVVLIVLGIVLSMVIDTKLRNTAVDEVIL
jgi:hypothetical protein